MKSLVEIDWDTAPSGATHYNTSCICPWLKETPPSYFDGGAWVEFSKLGNTLATENLRTAVKRPQEMETKNGTMRYPTNRNSL